MPNENSTGIDVRRPLAERMRPQKLDEVVGQDDIIGDGKILTEIVRKREPVNIIFWGPPGTGKTTLARIIAKEFQADFIEISAVTSGKKDVEKVVERAKQNWNLQTRTVLFVDEIHRFNKAQQDAFLPHVESGLITLIGATTENPSFEVISPLLSRSRVVIVKHLSKSDIIEVLKRAIKAEKATKRVSKAAIDYLAELSGGDARSALGDLELALSLSAKVGIDEVKEAAGRKVPGYDKKGDKHYDNISAFIKSMRGGDADAALYYLARMVQAGEDPKFIARRMVIFASEDIPCRNGARKSKKITPNHGRLVCGSRFGAQDRQSTSADLATQCANEANERSRFWRGAKMGSWLQARQELLTRRDQRC